MVDPNLGAWNPLVLLQEDGVHPNEAGNRWMADLVERRAWGFARPQPAPTPTPTPTPTETPEPGPEPRQPESPLPTLGNGEPVPAQSGPGAAQE